jgi:ribose transport system ATP-binding protein
MSETILEMSGIQKSFGSFQALKNVQLNIKKGEVHALLGENGAGKSTLMKILSGVYKPDAGTMKYKGRPLQLSHPKQAQEIGIGIVHQEFNLLPDLTVAQNIFVGREPEWIKGFIDETKMKALTKQIFAQLKVDIDPNAKVADLTVAEQQMVEIAKSLSANCELLIMDEPTAALSHSEIEQLFKVILDLKAKGVAIIYISHRLEELSQIVDRVTVLRDGEFIGTYPFHDVTIDELIQKMVGRSITSRFPVRKKRQRGTKILEVKGLTKKKTFHDIRFSLYQGEILGIAGLVGAGRTELARAIFGADPYDSGQIFIEGKEVKIQSPSEGIKAGIGYITEDRKKDGLALSLNIRENMMLSSYKKYSRWGLVRTDLGSLEAQSYVEKLKIKIRDLNQQVRDLSGGNQQKVVIAKWLCQNVKLLIIDEPTRGIDIGAKLEVYELMQELVEKGVGIIMISSELPEILGVCDRILVMSGGRITKELLREEATQEKILSYAAR